MNTLGKVKLIYLNVSGYPDPLVFCIDEFVSIKSRKDYKAVQNLRKFRNVKRRSALDFNLPIHTVPALEVSVDDWLLIPRRINLPRTDLTTEQLYVIGFWLAEGHLLKESKKGTSTFGKPVGLCFTNTNRSYLDQIQAILHEWFPKSASHIRTEHMKNPRHNTKYVLELRSWDAAGYFHPRFGEYSYGKQIGEDVYQSSGLLPLVCGFIDGDGCQFNKGRAMGRVSIITTSSTLAYQIRQILLDAETWVNLQYRDHTNAKWHRTYWLTVPISYTHLLTGATKVSIPEARQRQNYAIPASEGFYAKVKKITLLPQQD